MTPEECAEWLQRVVAAFEEWHNTFLLEVQPLLKVVRHWYIRQHYHGFFEKVGKP